MSLGHDVPRDSKWMWSTCERKRFHGPRKREIFAVIMRPLVDGHAIQLSPWECYVSSSPSILARVCLSHHCGALTLFGLPLASVNPSLK